MNTPNFFTRTITEIGELCASSGKAVNRGLRRTKDAFSTLRRKVRERLPDSVLKGAAKSSSFFRHFAKIIVNMVNIYIKKKAARSASEFSFNILLTIFPFLICINWFVGVLHTNFDDLIFVLTDFVPPTALSILTDYLDYLSANNSTAMLYAGLFMMLAPSSAALRSLQGILNDINNRGRQGNIWSFLLSFGFSIIFLLIVYLCMIILLSGKRLLNFLVEQFDIARVILGWNWMRFFVLFFLVILLMYLLYRFLPFSLKSPKRTFIGKVYPGVIFSTFALVGVSIVFSWFISLSTRYSLVYGSLASVVILMLWLFACSNIIIIGGIVNRIVNEYSRHLKRK